jgi:hypothetical protein
LFHAAGHDASQPTPSPSLSRPYTSGPITVTRPTYAGPLPLPPAQSTSLVIGTHGSYDGWHPEGAPAVGGAGCGGGDVRGGAVGGGWVVAGTVLGGAVIGGVVVGGTVLAAVVGGVVAVAVTAVVPTAVSSGDGSAQPVVATATTHRAAIHQCQPTARRRRISPAPLRPGSCHPGRIVLSACRT